jgi:hypothetical protein
MESRSEVKVLGDGRGSEAGGDELRILVKNTPILGYLPPYESGSQVQTDQVHLAPTHSRQLGLERELIGEGHVPVRRDNRYVHITVRPQLAPRGGAE